MDQLVGSLEELLRQAVAAGDALRVEDLVQDGADVNARLDDWTPLHRASARGHTMIARTLLAAGATVDAVGAADWTPLHRAARMGHIEVTELLLSSGADVHAQGVHGWTPLLRAAMAGQAGTGRLLIDAGADVMATNEVHGWTPLHWAAFSGSVELAEALIEAGAQVHYQAHSGTSPLGLATHYGNDEVRALLATQ